jgi:hypothetical protein
MNEGAAIRLTDASHGDANGICQFCAIGSQTGTMV